jgi:hypothetical protein
LVFSNGQNCSILSQNVPKFELYKHNDELFNIYYRIFISIFSNSSHLEWRAGLSDKILKGTHPGTIPAKFGLIWFSSFRGEDLSVIFYRQRRSVSKMATVTKNRFFFQMAKIALF